MASKDYSKEGGYEEYQQDVKPLIKKCEILQNLGTKVIIPYLGGHMYVSVRQTVAFSCDMITNISLEYFLKTIYSVSQQNETDKLIKVILFNMAAWLQNLCETYVCSYFYSGLISWLKFGICVDWYPFHPTSCDINDINEITNIT